MKSSTLFAIGLAASFLVSAQPKVKAATEGTTKFDGSWSVTVDFHEYKNPDGSTARAWIKHFGAEVKNAVMHGELGTRGAPDWYELNGKIQADGTAMLRATGVTGNPVTAFRSQRESNKEATAESFRRIVEPARFRNSSCFRQAIR